MTQDSDRRPATHRRSNRAGRSRPVLITPASAATQNGAENVSVPVQDIVEHDAPALSSSTNQQDMMIAAETQSPRPRTLPRFFSSVAKISQPQPVDTKQARIARATHNKAPMVAKDGNASVSPQLKQAASSARPTPTPARSTSPFKMRHIIGIAIYMLVAQFVGVALQALFLSQHIERVVVPTFKMPLFNTPVTITTSTVVFLIILVVLLVLLARFDLVPTSFTSASRQAQRGRTTPTSRRQESTSDSDMPSNTRQGVKGSNDDLYQEYQQLQRYRRRRERKK